ncbi:unnamed protein product [Closterium sp. NIES-65]|nr:unnamed protein product [Closterium sp. NIES-65]
MPNRLSVCDASGSPAGCYRQVDRFPSADDSSQAEKVAGVSFALLKTSVNVWDVSVCQGYISDFTRTRLYHELSLCPFGTEEECPFCYCRVSSTPIVVLDGFSSQ